MFTGKRAVQIIIVAILSCSIASAQGVKQQPKHPGDTVTYTVSFDGPNASSVKQVFPMLDGPSITETQSKQGFVRYQHLGWLQPSSSGVFIVSFKIPDNLIAGDYSLRLQVQVGDFRGFYDAGKDFQLDPIRVENRQDFPLPHVTVKPGN